MPMFSPNPALHLGMISMLDAYGMARPMQTMRMNPYGAGTPYPGSGSYGGSQGYTPGYRGSAEEATVGSQGYTAELQPDRQEKSWLMHPGPTLRGAGPQMPAIDLDSDDCRRGRHADRQGTVPLLGRLLVARLGQFVAEFGGDALHMPSTDRHPGQAQRPGGVGGGMQPGRGLRDRL
jgi:hypothetical protein